MYCDVIVPTYNNAKVLPLSLSGLFNQTIPDGWKIGLIFSDDGSTDNTSFQTSRLCRHSPWPYRLISHAHTGAAAARNRAISQSTADIIFFLGADIVLRPNALSCHLRFHNHRAGINQAALGIVKWDPRLRPSPFMEWMAHGGSQNDYDALLGQTKVDPRHYFYGSHLSLKRSVLKKNYFNESYCSYGWEDIDLGRRLADQCNLSLFVLSQAVGLHRHYYSTQDIIVRQKAMGLGFRTFWQKHPDAAPSYIKHPLHRLKYQLFQYSGLLPLLGRLISLVGQKKSTPTLYSIIINAYFWCGFHNLFPHKTHYIHNVFHNESTQ